MKTKNKNCGAYLVEVCIVIAIIAMLAVFALSVWHRETVTWPAAYAAWVKQTDNPKHLTYDEWRALQYSEPVPASAPVPQ